MTNKNSKVNTVYSKSFNPVSLKKIPKSRAVYIQNNLPNNGLPRTVYNERALEKMKARAFFNGSSFVSPLTRKPITAVKKLYTEKELKNVTNKFKLLKFMQTRKGSNNKPFVKDKYLKQLDGGKNLTSVMNNIKKNTKPKTIVTNNRYDRLMIGMMKDVIESQQNNNNNRDNNETINKSVRVKLYKEALNYIKRRPGTANESVLASYVLLVRKMYRAVSGLQGDPHTKIIHNHRGRIIAESLKINRSEANENHFRPFLVRLYETIIDRVLGPNALYQIEKGELIKQGYEEFRYRTDKFTNLMLTIGQQYILDQLRKNKDKIRITDDELNKILKEYENGLTMMETLKKILKNRIKNHPTNARRNTYIKAVNDYKGTHHNMFNILLPASFKYNSNSNSKSLNLNNNYLNNFVPYFSNSNKKILGNYNPNSNSNRNRNRAEIYMRMPHNNNTNNNSNSRSLTSNSEMNRLLGPEFAQTVANVTRRRREARARSGSRSTSNMNIN